MDRLRKDGPTGLAALLSAELQRQQAAIFSASMGQQQHQQQLQKQQSALGPLLLHPIPLLPAAALSPHSVFVPPDSVSISQIAFASPGSSSSNSSGGSRRQQQQLLLLRPEKGTWGLGRISTRDVSCNTNDGLSAPLNVSVFEAYRLHSNAATNEHGSIITVRKSASAAAFVYVQLTLLKCFGHVLWVLSRVCGSANSASRVAASETA